MAKKSLGGVRDVRAPFKGSLAISGVRAGVAQKGFFEVIFGTIFGGSLFWSRGAPGGSFFRVDFGAFWEASSGR